MNHAKLILILSLICLCGRDVMAHTANKVWFEFRDDGRFRVYTNYTIPALKEFRETYVDFNSQRKAEAFYWHLVRGGDFHGGKPEVGHFHQPSQKPEPW